MKASLSSDRLEINTHCPLGRNGAAADDFCNRFKGRAEAAWIAFAAPGV
jgi:hypothetical protein